MKELRTILQRRLRSLPAQLSWGRRSLAIAVFASSLVVRLHAATLASNGSRADVQAKVDSAVDGDIVTLPAGTFYWTSGVAISGKGVHLKGTGSGRVIARSTSIVSVGTGSKTFTLHSSGLGLYVGQTLRIYRTGGEHGMTGATGSIPWMQGTVTSYTGNTLTVDVGSSNGSGTHPLWIITSMASTTVIHDASSNVTLLSVDEDTNCNSEVSGIRFEHGSAGRELINLMRVTATAGGRPIFVHDCYFQVTGSGDAIKIYANRGIIWNCSFVALPFSRAPLAIHQVCDSITDSWTTPSTMGRDDATGTSNLYVEDCDFHAWLNATDFDANARVVFRHNVMNNAAIGTHGADSGPWGVRHYEIYDCDFIFNAYNDGNTLPLNWWFYLRGGTGVITDNTLPNIWSTDYSDKLEINMTLHNLQRASSNVNSLWGKDIPGVQYPLPRQVGMGRVTGTGNVQFPVAPFMDSITYAGDSEPLYIWNNTGGYSVGTSDYISSPPPPGCDTSADYVVAGRDYFNNGTAKPGYRKYIYPHPLRGSPRFVQITVVK